MVRSSKRVLRERAAALRLNESGCCSPWIAATVMFAGLTWFFSCKGGSFATAVVFMTVMALLACLVSLLACSGSRKLAKNRRNDSICKFARSFDCRGTDTLLIRAVFERFQEWLGAPVCKDDNLFEDWQMEGDDFDDAVEEVAGLTQRPLAGMEANPWYGKVCTPGDLVNFFMHQPLAKTVSA